MLTCVLSKLVRVMLVKLNLASRLKRQKSQSTSGISCSIPDIETSSLTVSNLATISMTATSDVDHKQTFGHV